MDEARYPIFTENYRAMEAYAIKTGSPQQLNQYMIYTEEEFMILNVEQEASEIVEEEVTPADANVEDGINIDVPEIVLQELAGKI